MNFRNFETNSCFHRKRFPIVQREQFYLSEEQFDLNVETEIILRTNGDHIQNVEICIYEQHFFLETPLSKLMGQPNKIKVGGWVKSAVN